MEGARQADPIDEQAAILSVCPCPHWDPQSLLVISAASWSCIYAR